MPEHRDKHEEKQNHPLEPNAKGGLGALVKRQLLLAEAREWVLQFIHNLITR